MSHVGHIMVASDAQRQPSIAGYHQRRRSHFVNQRVILWSMATAFAGVTLWFNDHEILAMFGSLCLFLIAAFALKKAFESFTKKPGG
jgi:hypothetical protein